MNIEQKILLALSVAEISPMVLIHTNGDVMDLEVVDADQNYLLDTTIRAGHGVKVEIDGKPLLVVRSIPLRVNTYFHKNKISSAVLDSQYFSDFIDDEPTWSVLEETDTVDDSKLSVYVNEKLWGINSDINLNHLNHDYRALTDKWPALSENEINKQLIENEELLMRNLDQRALKAQFDDAVA